MTSTPPDYIDTSVREFYKNFTYFHPGNSGVGGSDPQEPTVDWKEDPTEVETWLRTALTQADTNGYERGKREGSQKDFDEGYLMGAIHALENVELARSLDEAKMLLVQMKNLVTTRAITHLSKRI